MASPNIETAAGGGDRFIEIEQAQATVEVAYGQFGKVGRGVIVR